MTYERFLEIKEQYKDLEIKNVNISNLLFNRDVDRYRYENKNNTDYPFWKYLVRDFNFFGNDIYTQEKGIYNIIAYIKCNIFNEEEWKELLPYIYFEEFNKAYEELLDELAPFLGKIYRWRKDLYLEFWQGIFSNHWAIKGKTLEQSINNKKNGEKYNSILLDMYPIIKKFLEKYKDSHYTLMTRLTE